MSDGERDAASGAAEQRGATGAELAKVGFLGPAGTFSEEALYASAAPDAVCPVPFGTIYETVRAVRDGAVRWAVVPIENSLEGSVAVTLDLLADERGDLEVVGEFLLAVRHSLIAAEPLATSEIETVLSHPQVPGQCTHLLRGELSRARVIAASSTAEAVRRVSASGVRGEAALGTSLAAQIYGATVIRENVQDRDDNITRFVWIARRDEAAGGWIADAGGAAATRPPLAAGGRRGSKTSVVFWGAGADNPGWLVRCLDEFARRGINLTRIESRPRRAALGHYVFFADLQGGVREAPVAAAIGGLRVACEHVLVLGSYEAA